MVPPMRSSTGADAWPGPSSRNVRDAVGDRSLLGSEPLQKVSLQLFARPGGMLSWPAVSLAVTFHDSSSDLLRLTGLPEEPARLSGAHG